MKFLKDKFEEWSTFDSQTDFFYPNLKIYQVFGLSIWPNKKTSTEVFRWLIYLSFLIVYPLFFLEMYESYLDFKLDIVLDNLTMQLHHIAGMVRYLNMVIKKKFLDFQ